MNQIVSERDGPDDPALLIGRVAEARDRVAFEALYCQFAPRIKALMMKSGSDAALAEDIAQDVMISVWHKAELYSAQRGSLAAWIFTIARNARIDRLRKQSSKPYLDIDEIEFASDAADAETELGTSQTADLVAAAMAELPDEQREIITLSYVEGLPQGEIAKRLALPLGTVKSRMRLAYGKLRYRLEAVR